MEKYFTHSKFILYKNKILNDEYYDYILEITYLILPSSRRDIEEMLGKPHGNKKRWGFSEDQYNDVLELLLSKFSNTSNIPTPHSVTPRSTLNKDDAIIDDTTKLFTNISINEENKYDFTNRIGNTLMAQYSPSKEWKLAFNKRKRSCALCDYKKKTIFISLEYIESIKVSKEDIQNTILHEIAHCLTPGHNHDEVWKTKAISIGCDGKRCFREAFTEYKYRIKCPCGKNNFGRHVVKKALMDKRCNECYQGLYAELSC